MAKNPYPKRGNARPGFECDIDPETHSPRVRFNFASGVQASLVFRVGSVDTFRASCVRLAELRHGKVVELGEQEASAEEAAAFLYELSQRKG